jgi:phosphate transport system protein
MADELRKSFHEELDSIKSGIVRMAGRVSESIPRGTEAFLDTDLAAAQRVIEEDDILDAMTVDLEERIYQVIALQAPVAGDLRAVAAALWLTSEIERSGDLMTNIAKATRRVFGTGFDGRIRGLLVQMSEEAARIFRLAIDAYMEGNAGLAAALPDIDDRLDELNKQTIGAIFEAHEDGALKLPAAVQLALVCRYYERIGDHAVNIGERVRYMVDGWLPEHTGAVRAAMRSIKLGDEPRG